MPNHWASEAIERRSSVMRNTENGEGLWKMRARRIREDERGGSRGGRTGGEEEEEKDYERKSKIEPSPWSEE